MNQVHRMGDEAKERHSRFEPYVEAMLELDEVERQAGLDRSIMVRRSPAASRRRSRAEERWDARSPEDKAAGRRFVWCLLVVTVAAIVGQFL